MALSFGPAGPGTAGGGRRTRVSRKCPSDQQRAAIHAAASPWAAAAPPPRAAALAAAPAARRALAGRRAVVVVRALGFFDKQEGQELWNYQGTCVRKLSLQELQLLHRLSFGHRNQRSYLVVLYEPGSAACQAFEQQVERLASGLRHERAFVAAALDVSGRDAASFASTMLGVDRVPAVLLYPEAARGCLRFLGPDMSAEGMLSAVNNARRKALPATATSAGAAEWQMAEASTPLAVTALRAAAVSGDKDAVLSTLQRVAPVEPTPLAAAQSPGYWTAGRGALWGGMLLLSLLYLSWDLRLADAWEDWCLAQRERQRERSRRDGGRAQPAPAAAGQPARGAPRTAEQPRQEPAAEAMEAPPGWQRGAGRQPAAASVLGQQQQQQEEEQQQGRRHQQQEQEQQEQEQREPAPPAEGRAVHDQAGAT